MKKEFTEPKPNENNNVTQSGIRMVDIFCKKKITGYIKYKKLLREEMQKWAGHWPHRCISYNWSSLNSSQQSIIFSSGQGSTKERKNLKSWESLQRTIYGVESIQNCITGIFKGAVWDLDIRKWPGFQSRGSNSTVTQPQLHVLSASETGLWLQWILQPLQLGKPYLPYQLL